MINIINADIYRLRHSKGLRYVFIGLVLVILVAAAALFFVSSDAFAGILDRAVESTGEILTQSDLNDLNEIRNLGTNGGAVFARVILSSNFTPYFFLFFIMLFCSEFGAGIFRNTHSYEDNRNRVYFSKLFLNIICCVLMFAFSIILSWLIGGIFFGFKGFTAQYFTQMVVTFLLMLPTQIAMVCLGHFIVALTKKSGATVAAYLIGPMILTVVLQLLAMMPGLDWMMMLDWSNNSKLLISYWTLPVNQILLAIFAWLGIAALTTVLGANHYRRADLH